MSIEPIAAFAAAHHGVITRRQAAELGVHSTAVSRLLRRDVLRLAGPGVLIVNGSPPTWQQHVYASTLHCREQGLSIGRASARLHRVDGLEHDPTVHVTFPRTCRPDIPGVLVSHTGDTYPAADRVVIDGIPCAGLARTICDLASFAPESLERAIDDFERRGYSLTWLAQTADRLQSRGRPGIALVGREIERRVVGPQVRGSWFEKLVELCLASPRLPGVERQHVIRNDAGKFLARVDLAVPSVRFAIEAHSRKHHTGPRAEVLDERRERKVVAEGWLVEYLGWSDVVQTPAAVCRHIESVAARRARDFGVPWPGPS